jgi:nucleotide-binding universal stress UspA family protein
MYKHILVPVDIADPALAKPAVATAVDMARNAGGSVRLVHVVPLTSGMLIEYVPPNFEAEQRKAAEEALAEIVRDTGLSDTQVSCAVRQGGIYHEVLEEAKAIGADLIVMSSHRPAMRTYFLGSNAGHIVRYAPCSVLVVREPALDRKTA